MANKKTEKPLYLVEPRYGYLGLNHEMGFFKGANKYGLKEVDKLKSLSDGYVDIYDDEYDDTSKTKRSSSKDEQGEKEHEPDPHSKDRSKYGTSTQKQLDKLVGDLVSKAKFNGLKDCSSRKKIYDKLALVANATPEVVASWVKGYRKPKEHVLDSMIDFTQQLIFKIDEDSVHTYEATPKYGLYTNFAKERAWELVKRLDAFVHLKYDEAKSEYPKFKADFENYQFVLPVEIYEYFEDYVFEFLEPEFTDNRLRFRVYRNKLCYKEITPCYPDNLERYSKQYIGESTRDKFYSCDDDSKRNFVMFFFSIRLHQVKKTLSSEVFTVYDYFDYNLAALHKGIEKDPSKKWTEADDYTTKKIREKYAQEHYVNLYNWGE